MQVSKSTNRRVTCNLEIFSLSQLLTQLTKITQTPHLYDEVVT